MNESFTPRSSEYTNGLAWVMSNLIGWCSVYIVLSYWLSNPVITHYLYIMSNALEIQACCLPFDITSTEDMRETISNMPVTFRALCLLLHCTWCFTCRYLAAYTLCFMGFCFQRDLFVQWFYSYCNISIENIHKLRNKGHSESDIFSLEVSMRFSLKRKDSYDTYILVSRRSVALIISFHNHI